MIDAPQVVKQFIVTNVKQFIVTNVLFMDSGFEDKQNRVLVMTRKGIYMYISYI